MDEAQGILMEAQTRLREAGWRVLIHSFGSETVETEPKDGFVQYELGAKTLSIVAIKDDKEAIGG